MKSDLRRHRARVSNAICAHETRVI